MVRRVIGLMATAGLAGGSVTVGAPMVSNATLILVNSCEPVRVPLWPSLGFELQALAAAGHASRCSWESCRHWAATPERRLRINICAGVRGLVGMTSARLIWP